MATDGTPTRRPTSTGVFISGALQVAQTERTEALVVGGTSEPCIETFILDAALVSIMSPVQCYIVQGATPVAVKPTAGTPGCTPIPANLPTLLAKRQGYNLAIIADSAGTAYIEVVA